MFNDYVAQLNKDFYNNNVIQWLIKTPRDDIKSSQFNLNLFFGGIGQSHPLLSKKRSHAKKLIPANITSIFHHRMHYSTVNTFW